METSGGALKSSICVIADWPGWNALASGLKENCLAEAAGERGSGAGEGGIKVVEVLERCLDVATSSPSSSPFFSAKCREPAFELLRESSEGK